MSDPAFEAITKARNQASSGNPTGAANTLEAYLACLQAGRLPTASLAGRMKELEAAADQLRQTYQAAWNEPLADDATLEQILERLTSREQTIVRLRFGLGVPGGEEKTQKEVADVLGISQSYISRLEKKIMQRLKREMVKYS